MRVARILFSLLNAACSARPSHNATWTRHLDTRPGHELTASATHPIVAGVTPPIEAASSSFLHTASPDGTALGQFHAVLRGTSLLGQAQDVVVEGEVSGGAAQGDGVSFN